MKRTINNLKFCACQSCLLLLWFNVKSRRCDYKNSVYENIYELSEVLIYLKPKEICTLQPLSITLSTFTKSFFALFFSYKVVYKTFTNKYFFSNKRFINKNKNIHEAHMYVSFRLIYSNIQQHFLSTSSKNNSMQWECDLAEGLEWYSLWYTQCRCNTILLTPSF